MTWSILCDHEYRKALTLLYAVKTKLLKQKTIINHPKSSSTKRNHSKPPRNHPKLIAPMEHPLATPLSN